MKELTADERQDLIEHTKRIAASMKTHRKGRYNFGGSSPAQSNFSAVANFSSDYSDFGSFDGIYDGEDIAQYNAGAKEVAAMSEIRRLTLSSTIKDNLKQWILKKNNISNRNRAAKMEAQKAFDNR